MQYDLNKFNATVLGRANRSQGLRRVRCSGVAASTSRAVMAMLGVSSLGLSSATTGCGARVVVDHETHDDGGTNSQGGGGAGGTASANSSSSIGNSSSSSSSSGGNGGGGGTAVEHLVEMPLGLVPFDKAISFEIPPNTLGFTILAKLDGPGAASKKVGIKNIVSPDIKAVVFYYAMFQTLTLPVFYNDEWVAAAVPQRDSSPSMPVQTGTWQLELGDGGYPSDLKTANVTIWRRQTVDGLFHGGSVDVNLYVVDGAGSQQYAQASVVKAFQGFAGLQLGSLTTSTLGAEWAYIDDITLPQAFEETVGASGKPAINLIVTSKFGGGLDGAVGVTAWLPANGFDHGTRLSGIAITLSQNAAFDALVIRHETGHFAGLLHTSEFISDYGDALDDTEQCPNATTQPENCPDYKNLMFPTGGDGTAFLSPKQLTVIQGSATYRGVVEAGGVPAPPFPLFNSGNTPSAQTFVSPFVDTTNIGSVGEPALGDWAHGLPPAISRLLTQLYCVDLSARYRVDYRTLLQGEGPLDAHRLLAIGKDPTAPLHARERALTAIGHNHPSSKLVGELARLAEDRNLPRNVRMGAIAAVIEASPTAGKALASRLSADPDQGIARMAHRFK